MKIVELPTRETVSVDDVLANVSTEFQDEVVVVLKGVDGEVTYYATEMPVAIANLMLDTVKHSMLTQLIQGE